MRRKDSVYRSREEPASLFLIGTTNHETYSKVVEFGSDARKANLVCRQHQMRVSANNGTAGLHSTMCLAASTIVEMSREHELGQVKRRPSS